MALCVHRCHRRLQLIHRVRLNGLKLNENQPQEIQLFLAHKSPFNLIAIDSKLASEFGFGFGFSFQLLECCSAIYFQP